MVSPLGPSIIGGVKPYLQGAMLQFYVYFPLSQTCSQLLLTYGCQLCMITIKHHCMRSDDRRSYFFTLALCISDIQHIN